MPDILLPRAEAERRQAAHLRDDGRTWSLCGMRNAAGCDVIADTPQNRSTVTEWRHRRICGLCLDILRRRAQAVETAQREAERKAQLKKPTKRQVEAEKWLAFTGAPPKNWRLKHDEDHTVERAAVIE